MRPATTGCTSRYKRAARFLKDWLREGILRQDDHPALYVYHQTFEVDGKMHTRKGFLARVRLEPIGQGKIYPHEQTLAGPKADRLALYHATGFNLSPVFGLYPDTTDEVHRKLEAGLRDRTPLVATDHLGVENRLWIVTDQETHTVVSGLMAAKPVFIADGHHRYETALKYRDEVAASGQSSGHDDPSQFCLMMLVGMSDPGLLILPTHRLVSGYPGLTAEALKARLEPQFEVQLAGAGETGCRAAWDADRAQRGARPARLWHGRRRPVAAGAAALRLRHGSARPQPERGLAQPGRERAARPGAQGAARRPGQCRPAATCIRSARS